MRGAVLEGERLFRTGLEITTGRFVRPGSELIDRSGISGLERLEVVRDLSLELGIPNQREQRLFQHMDVLGKPNRIHDDRAEFPQRVDCLVENANGLWIPSHEIAANSNARSSKGTGLEKLGVVRVELARALAREGITGINSCHDTKNNCDIGDTSGNWSDCVETQRERYEAVAAKK